MVWVSLPFLLAKSGRYEVVFFFSHDNITSAKLKTSQT
jgi:hypothetical protein